MLVKRQHFGPQCYFCQCQSVTLIPLGDDTHLKRPSFKNEETHDGYNLTRGLFFFFLVSDLKALYAYSPE